MKFRIKISIALSALSIFGGHLSASAQKAPVDIQLNGIAAIFGDHVALFTISPSQNFSLSEGESHSGIKLLAIDFPSRCVRIDDHGSVRIIRICGTPTSSAVAPTMINGREVNPDGTLKILNGSSYNSTSSTTQTNASGVVSFASGGGSANSSGSNNSTDKNASSTGNDADTNQNPPVYQWWRQEAQKIEDARIETADRVMAGTWQPYPLTPLTPPNTPAQLISSDNAFMDHGPGIVISGN